MTYISVKGSRCGCENVSKNGKTSYGKQQYICNNINCSKSSFILDFSYNASKPEVKSKIITMAINGSGIRDIARLCLRIKKSIKSQKHSIRCIKIDYL